MPVVRARLLAPLLLALALLGCPEPPPSPAGGGPGGGAPQDPGPDRAPDPDPAPAGGDAGDGSGPALPPAAGGGEEDWTVMPAAVAETIYPDLQPLAKCPPPTALKGLDGLAEGQQPDPTRVRLLKELVGYLLHPRLRPSDPDTALGMDADGRLFMKIGQGKAQGVASLENGQPETASRRPVFTLTFEQRGEGCTSIEELRKRVAKVLVAELAEELKRPGCRLEAHPKVKGGAGTAGLAMLDRGGFGMQFPYLYAYANDAHLAVLLQEIPHESLDGSMPNIPGGPPGPGGDGR